MSDVNHQDINLAATYVSQDHSRCCCRSHYTQGICAKCKPTVQICCMKGVHSACGFELLFARGESSGPGASVAAEWEPGDECDFIGPTNLCGELFAIWGEGAKCGPWMRLQWQVEPNCTDVKIRLSHGSFTGPWNTVGRDWYLVPLVIEDPMSRYYYGVDPELYHLETITFTGCDDSVEMTTGGTDEIFIDGDLEFFTLGSWTGSDSYYGSFYARGTGSCICGKGINCASDGGASSTYRAYIWWWYDLWTCGLYVYVTHSSVGAWIYLTGVTCITEALPLYIPLPGLDNLRWKLTLGSSCEHGGEPEDPDPEPPDPPGPPPDPPPDPCTSGCWPPCVMCPTRKNLYAVLEGAPTCCVSGSFALEWVGASSEGTPPSPTAGYYQLPSPVGGPLWDCGFIDVLRVSCVDLDSISVRLIYREVEGTVVDITRTLSVACSGGEMESSTIELPGMFGEEDTLCGYGGDVGGVLRIVSG